MYLRLSLLMFLQYAVAGAWVPLFSLHLQELGFSPLELAWCIAGSAVGAILAPLLAGQIADRWLAAEKCIAICALVAGLLLFVLAQLREPWLVFLTVVAHWLMMLPVVTLGVSLCFTHLQNPPRQFGAVRLWGTVGWIVPGLLLGYWYSLSVGNWADSLWLGGTLSFVLAVYALTLPHTPPAQRYTTWLAPLGALHLFRRRRFLIFCLCSCCLYVTMAFHSQMTPLVLERLGLSRDWLAAALTLSQSAEVILLGLLPLLLRQLGVRRTMLLGALAWVLGLAALWLGEPAWLVIPLLPLHGVYVCCVLIAGQVFVNGEAGDDIRASAQGLLAFINGAGLLCGHLLVGVLRAMADGALAPAFAVAVALAVGALLLLAVGFQEPEPVEVQSG